MPCSRAIRSKLEFCMAQAAPLRVTWSDAARLLCKGSLVFLTFIDAVYTDRYRIYTYIYNNIQEVVMTCQMALTFVLMMLATIYVSSIWWDSFLNGHRGSRGHGACVYWLARVAFVYHPSNFTKTCKAVRCSSSNEKAERSPGMSCSSAGYTSLKRHISFFQRRAKHLN